MTKGHIAVDLDGTLAFYDHWRGADHIGAPIPAMARRVKHWLGEGKEVVIFTARVGGNDERELMIARHAIRAWCVGHLGRALPITCKKDMHTLAIWDDRAVQIELNTGRRMDAVPDPDHWTP